MRIFNRKERDDIVQQSTEAVLESMHAEVGDVPASSITQAVKEHAELKHLDSMEVRDALERVYHKKHGGSGWH